MGNDEEIASKPQTYLKYEDIIEYKYLKRAAKVIEKVSTVSLKLLKETMTKPPELVLNILKVLITFKVKSKNMYRSCDYNWNPSILLEIIDEAQFIAELKNVVKKPIDY